MFGPGKSRLCSDEANGLSPETLERVEKHENRPDTPLKRGVNERKLPFLKDPGRLLYSIVPNFQYAKLPATRFGHGRAVGCYRFQGRQIQCLPANDAPLE